MNKIIDFFEKFPKAKKLIAQNQNQATTQERISDLEDTVQALIERSVTENEGIS